MSSAPARHLGQLRSEDAVLFVCDVQDKFVNVISGFDAIVDVASRLVRAAPHLGFPVIVTEQYPQRLGSTVGAITDHLPEGSTVVAKTRFSMLVPEVEAKLEELGRKSAIIVGLETHVCVLQTGFDLLARGYDVHLVTDGVSSRTLQDRAAGVRRLVEAGAFPASSEMVLFQMIGDTNHPGFKPVSATLKEPRENLLPPLP